LDKLQALAGKFGKLRFSNSRNRVCEIKYIGRFSNQTILLYAANKTQLRQNFHPQQNVILEIEDNNVSYLYSAYITRICCENSICLKLKSLDHSEDVTENTVNSIVGNQ